MPRRASGIVISPNRLFAAADVLLDAVNSPDGVDTRVAMHNAPHRVNGSLPRGVFTCEEFIEAMAMLIRMGLVPRCSPVVEDGHSDGVGKDGIGS